MYDFTIARIALAATGGMLCVLVGLLAAYALYEVFFKDPESGF